MNGKAVVITTAGAIDLYAGITIHGIKGDQHINFEEVQDFAGFDGSWLARNEYVEVKLTLKLTAASKAAAIANGVFLLPLATLTLTGFDLPWLNAAGVGGRYTGNWQYRGASIDLLNDKTGGSEANCRKYADPTQNTAATTAAA
jgi:hypothetical protein